MSVIFRHFIFRICGCLNWLAFRALHSSMSSVSIFFIEWQQCMVRLMDYTVLCGLSEILRFLDSYLPIFDNNCNGGSVSPWRR